MKCFNGSCNFHENFIHLLKFTEIDFLKIDFDSR
jgi:hypothetical protein